MVVERSRHFWKIVVARALWTFLKISGYSTETLWQAWVPILGFLSPGPGRILSIWSALYLAVSGSGTGYYRTSPGTCPDPDSTNISFHGPTKFLVLDLVPTFPFCSRRIQRAFGVLPVVPMAYQCRLKFCHWQSFVTIGNSGMPMVTIGCHLVSPLVANLADNLESRQNYQRAKLTSFSRVQPMKIP